MALNANALITLEQAKSHIDMPGSNNLEDARLELFINAASERVAKYCDRVLVADDYTEFHHGRRNNILLTEQYPINSIAELRISGERDFTTSESLVDVSEYTIADHDSTVLYSRIFPSGFSNVRITYNAGFVTIPSDLQLACLWCFEWYYRHRDRHDMGKTSTSKGDESIGILAECPPMIKEILLDYKRTEMPNIESPVRNL